MSSFVATDPKPAAAVIGNDGFWPDIDPTAARAAMRLDDGTVPAERLAHTLIAAMIEVARDLAAWKAERIAEGYASLADVPSTGTINGEPVEAHCYLRAVYCYAKATIIERMPDYDLTAAGQRKADQLDEAPCTLRRDGLWAITRLQGRGRCTVGLI